jgi:hypothetical protein
VFRTVSGPVSPWESLLPPELLRLPEELARVDALLDDPAFFAPFGPYFHPVPVRPAAPVECYLRLMFLSSGTGWAMRACAPRSAIRSRGGGSAGSRWMPRCRIRRR